jgi:hypothetical protein
MAKRDPGRAVPVDTGALAGANQGLHSPSAGKNRKLRTFLRRAHFCCHARDGKGGSGEGGSQLHRVPTLLTLHCGAFLPEVRPVVSSAPCDSLHPARKSYPGLEPLLTRFEWRQTHPYTPSLVPPPRSPARRCRRRRAPCRRPRTGGCRSWRGTAESRFGGP